jgi:hypothetical protein
MATLTDLIAKVRTEINDQAKQFSKSFTCDGATTTFNLGVHPVDPSTLLVKDNTTTLLNPADYTVESLYGVIHTTTAPASGHTLYVNGNVWRYFSDDEITTFVNTALLQHTSGRSDAYGSAITVATLPELEVYPLVVLCTVEALFALATDASYDININAPDGVSIPRGQRFQQMSSFINQRMEHYKSICAALNIGLWRIEMGTLRRVSRTTNKLVPIYVAQEIDDSSSPDRVYMKNDLNGYVSPTSTATTLDMMAYQGDTFTQTITLPSTVGFTTSASVTANVAANTNITIPANTNVTVGMNVTASGGTVTTFPSNVTVTKVVNSTTIWLSAAVNVSATTLTYINQTLDAQVRTYPGSPTLWATFTIAIVDPTARTVSLSLPSSTTATLPVRTFWDIQGTSTTNQAVTTYFKGQIFTTPQVTIV